jgi:hypothetical protein
VSSRVVAEWDWTVLRSWRRLHAPDRWDDPREEMSDPTGRTACGRVGELSIPGMFSRLGLPRCRHCCRMTGMPPGDGSPKNDNACRPLVEQRLRALGLAA